MRVAADTRQAPLGLAVLTRHRLLGSARVGLQSHDGNIDADNGLLHFDGTVGPCNACPLHVSG